MINNELLRITGVGGLEPTTPLMVIFLKGKMCNHWYYLPQQYVDENTHFIAVPSEKYYVNQIPMFANQDVEESGAFYIGHN